MISGTWCERCRVGLIPATARCGHCAGPVAMREFPAEGELETFTTVYSAPGGFEPGFTVGVVRLAPGVRAAALWTGQGVLAVGAGVTLTPEGERLRFAPPLPS